MRFILATILASTTLVLPMLSSAELDNNALYQWTSKNGTPTYSPDPPPKGVKYVVVGTDLKPLAQQPALMPNTQNQTDNTAVVVAPATTKWKPVRYANDPAIKSQTILKNRREPAVIVTAEATPPVLFESDECLILKREKLVLESQFARAKTDTEMDNTILNLRDKSDEYNQRCSH